MYNVYRYICDVREDGQPYGCGLKRNKKLKRAGKLAFLFALLNNFITFATADFTQISIALKCPV